MITDLLTLLKGGGVEIPEGVRQAGTLTQYAVQSRYPGAAEDVSHDEYVRALGLAEDVVRWVEGQLAGPFAAGA